MIEAFDKLAAQYEAEIDDLRDHLTALLRENRNLRKWIEKELGRKAPSAETIKSALEG